MIVNCDNFWLINKPINLKWTQTIIIFDLNNNFEIILWTETRTIINLEMMANYNIFELNDNPNDLK
jgi:hypothetical protein